MIFCTQCGHKNVAEARFCEECGKPLVQRIAAATAAGVPEQTSATPTAHVATASAATTPINGKLLKYAAAGVALLVVIGAGLFFLLAPESASNERFAAAIERSLAANSQAYKVRYCLSNFAYNLDPVQVNEQDQGTRQWLAVLTKAGLYSEPELIEDTTGYFVVRKLRYSKTEAGKSATQDGKLCVADGVSVAKVESFTPPQKLGDTQASRATVTLKLRNPMPWVMTEETRSQSPQIKAEFTDSVVMALKDGKWDVADQRALQNAMMAERKLASKQQSGGDSASSGSGGLLDSLKNMFSFSAGNPLMGKWKSDVMGITVATFEFDSNSMVSNGQKVNVRYEVEVKRVTVYVQGESSGSVFNVIDHDTLSVNTGLAELKLKRVN